MTPIEQVEVRLAVDKFRNSLTDRDQAIFDLSLWPEYLGSEGITQKEMGELLGLSQSRVGVLGASLLARFLRWARCAFGARLPRKSYDPLNHQWIEKVRACSMCGKHRATFTGGRTCDCTRFPQPPVLAASVVNAVFAPPRPPTH